MGWVIRRLGLEQEETTLPEPDTAQARAELAAASLDAVQEHMDSDVSEHGDAAAELVEEYKVRAERASIEGQDVETRTGQLVAQQRLRLVAIEAAREKLMEQTETDLVNKRLTEETILRQQQILTRMLEVEKSARERDQDTKREAQAAQNKPPVFPPAFDKYKASKERQTELLRTTPPTLTPYYQREVGEYFQKMK